VDNSIVQALEFESDSIRTTPDGRMSVFDFIRVVGGQKGERKVWERLVAQYPELKVTDCHSYKFPGKGNRTTLVAGKTAILQILGLLPGAAGKKYRQEAARLVLAFYQAPESLANAIIDRTEDPEALKRIEQRLKTKISNKGLNSAISQAGGTCFAAVADINNIAIVGGTAKQIQAARGVKKTRDGLSRIELAMLETAELLEQEAIEEERVRGDRQIISTCKNVATTMASLRSRKVQQLA
jgi:hypothetical protein